MTKEEQYLAEGGTLRNGMIPTEKIVPQTFEGPVIAVDSLNKSTTPIPTVNPNPVFGNKYSALTQSAVDSTSQTPEQPQPQTDTTEEVLRKYMLASEGTAGKTAFTQEQNRLAGVTDIIKKQNTLASRINTLNTQIQGLQSEASSIPTKFQEQYKGTGATVGGVASDIASATRLNQLQQSALTQEALRLQSEYYINQGELENAQYVANEAVNLKYGDIENDLARYEKQLSVLKPFMTAEQEKIAKEKEVQLQNQKTALADKKKLQIDLINIAQQNGDMASASLAMQLDPNSSTFQSDLANLQAKVKLKAEKVTGQSDFEQAFLRDNGRLPTVQELLDYKAKERSITTSEPKLTEAERKAKAITTISNVFVPGVTLKTGVPTLDSSGQITPEAWLLSISKAPSEGLTRKEFIEQFAYLIVGADGKVSQKYQLTPAELKLIGAEQR